MTLLIALLALFDAAILPTRGILTSILFVLIVAMGIWKTRNYKSWYILSLVFITLAVSFYFFGSGIGDEGIIHKLSDWSLIFLLLGTIQLWRKK